MYQSYVTTAQLDQYHSAFVSDRANRIARDAVTAAGLYQSSRNPEIARKNSHEFSLSLPTTEVTNQKQSGRCWLFAAMNVMRSRIIQKYQLKDFELSQNYMMFWDKFEKSNWFLENVLDTLSESVGSRIFSHLLSSPLSDGGQWDMMANLVNKYGVIPKQSMPETVASSNTKDMNRILTEILRNDACALRTAAGNSADREVLEQIKSDMLKDIYRMLCICLGEPPRFINMEARTKNGDFIQETGLTPMEFFKKYVDMDLNDYVSLINAPTSDKPFYRQYTVSMLGNVREGKPVCYINLPIQELKSAAIAQLKAGEPVWFGCDMGQRSSRDTGVMDLNVYDFKDFLQIEFPMNKAQRLDYCQSKMTHAMVFQGVNLTEDGVPTRWRVENSWGDEPGKKGYFVMSDEWFSEYMYQIVINKKYLTQKQLDVLNTEMIVLEPWDPMGSLAL